MAEMPIPIYLHSFCLSAQRDSANNLNVKTAHVIDDCKERVEIDKGKIYGIVTDSPNVMV